MLTYIERKAKKATIGVWCIGNQPWMPWKWCGVNIANIIFRTQKANAGVAMSILQRHTLCWKMVFAPTEKGKTMVVDIGIVKNHIKPKADSTLRNMRKDDLIEYIRCLENNYNVAVSFNNQQAKNIEALGITEVVRCNDCKFGVIPYGDEHDGWIECSNIHGRPLFSCDGFCSYGERRTDG